MMSGLLDRLALLATFARTRWGYRFKDRQALERYQRRCIERLLRGPALRAPFYAARRHLAFEHLPVVAKRDVTAAFADFNVQRIDLTAAREFAFHAERSRDFAPMLADGVTVGSSSGTSGQPMIFLVGRRERSVWAGAMLARMLSGALLRRILNPFRPAVRIAFFLRANSNLYTTVRSTRVRFEFFDLLLPLQRHLAALSAYSPDVLVAPASVLRSLAEHHREGRLDIRPVQIVSVAEPLEEEDSQAVASEWGVVPQQIYQCTEGFLGYSCAHGALHLNEEFVHIEPAWLDADRSRFEAIVTDFSRHTQLFVKFRMDDVLRHDPRPCPCGRVSQRLASIEGRSDDVLWLRGVGSDDFRPVFPDQLRRAMMLALAQGRDYRIEQHGGSWRIAACDDDGVLGPAVPAGIEREIETLCAGLGLVPPALSILPWTMAAPAHKRRRIRCVIRPSAAGSP